MKYREAQYNKWINRALEIAGYEGIKIEDVLKEEGEKVKGKKPKDYLPYYLKYTWKDEEQVEKWHTYLINQVRGLNSSYTDSEIESDVDMIEAIIGLSEVNIIKEKVRLMEEEKVV